jgi:diguanylate cyclase (GGDEF)-like protein
VSIGVFTKLRKAISGDLSTFGGPTLSDAASGRLRAEQMAAVMRYSPAMMLANACNALILVAAVWPSPQARPALAWASLVVALSMLHGRRRHRAPAGVTQIVSERAVTRTTRNALMLGCIWGALPLLFFGRATSGGQLIITCLCGGMLCGGAFAFAALPVAAIAFMTPIFIGSAIAIATNGDHAYVLVALLMIVYTSILLTGVFSHALQVAHKLVSQIEVEREMRRDPLTGLPNRLSFAESLQKSLARLSQCDTSLALFYLDLDEFKAVNDRFGHAAGDELLIQAAGRLQATTRTIDTIARLAGDEFAVIATVKEPDEAAALADRIAKAFDEPFIVTGSPVTATVTVGIALAPSDGVEADCLVKNADAALYHAKRRLGRSIQFFDTQDAKEARERRILERDLRKALERQEFFLVFQPVFNLDQDRITNYEALLRWRHPIRGVIGPGSFIRAAEETGLIGSIGHWVIREACQAAVSWPPTTSVAVNISTAQLCDGLLLPLVMTVLEDTGLSASRLEIEITESIFASGSNAGVSLLKNIRNLGARISLDDFGTGFSSLTYLRTMPLDKVKIDVSFIRDMLTDSGCFSIVKSVIALAHDFGLSTTAEGVERNDQLTCLRKLGCTEVQGNLLGAPEPMVRRGASITARVDDWRRNRLGQRGKAAYHLSVSRVRRCRRAHGLSDRSFGFISGSSRST